MVESVFELIDIESYLKVFLSLNGIDIESVCFPFEGLMVESVFEYN